MTDFTFRFHSFAPFVVLEHFPSLLSASLDVHLVSLGCNDYEIVVSGCPSLIRLTIEKEVRYALDTLCAIWFVWRVVTSRDKLNPYDSWRIKAKDIINEYLKGDITFDGVIPDNSPRK